MAASLPEKERDLLRRIDACVDRMRAFTPDEPYVLSIPQDEPKFHHHSHHSSQMWRTGTPFRPDDDPNQQYQTFYYHEPLSDVFHLHRNSHYQKDNASVSSQPREKESSTQSTPSMHPKKKISLAAYANKKTQPDSKDVKHDKPKHNKTLSESTSSQSLKSRDSANLPRMLSPLRDRSQQPQQPRPSPNQNPPKQPLLPPRLISPTLPPSIIASLEANPYQPSRHKHASKRLPSPLPPVAEQSRKHPPNIPEPKTRDSPQEEEQDSTPSSLVVHLKIPKSMRKNIGRYLQMKPQPQVIRVLPPEKQTAPAQATPQAAKRPRPAEEDTPLLESKRKKAIKPELSTTKQEPSTPSSATLAVQKATRIARSATKDLRTSAAMKRVESTDSMVNGTPQSSRQVNGVTKPSPSSGSIKTAESKAWVIEAARIGNLGRELKHAVSALDKAESNNGHTESRPRETAAAMSLESILLFMLSFYCTDRGLAARNPPAPLDGGHTWATIPAFINFVRTRCQYFPALDGVACQLGAVCNAMIVLRLTTIRERPQDMTPEETRALHNAASTGLKVSKDGSSKLSLSTIMSSFPKTWKKAMNSNVSGTGAEDDVKIGRYAGDIALPLGMDTEPLIAVRVGYALLREWCASKNLKYEMKLGL
ncbi:hypothetical protein M436DRAFT_38597 [Aureobasidium namibiae CBS 147.97]|uniref:Uncharacterized protein n=1 Tax=Aureobasidium namibiae CBS 147.97 TaxID=1043004 RepID=A0A074WTI4_9PEZI